MFGGAGISRGSIITSVSQIPTPSIEVAEKVLSQFPDRAKVPVRYFSVTDRHSERLIVVRIDRTWFPMMLWKRDDNAGKDFALFLQFNSI